MSDGSISRLDKLRALQEWLDWQLRQTRGRIQQLEAQERQEEQRAQERSERGKPRVEERRRGERRPRIPDWGIDDIGVGTPRSEVHRGDCFAAGKRLRAISREQALAALADGAPPCEVCRPDTALGAP
ncbi:DUF6233 domain-containing protein (plasmid) [Streptomyces sp. NBC_00841]|uniref:DUF6233 domain-containing protein n=1 Tax=unclassified Streptomyces TaxID=2593676 RepID=UPI00224D9029|nr:MULTISPECIES: DUF6233 domain-containing protein [unclassified Streptomyces]MCX4538405.1 DUF6233 domain-containing protein [Streptomyces sp. NBC_01669]WSA05762.1 DUF6233 domain-containing protein [Streptomyces sp. NBC_00841]